MHIRRHLVPLIAVAIVAAGCAAPAPAPIAPAARIIEAPATSGWQAEWEQTLAAAKREGVVVVSGPPGDGIRQAMTAFQASYPDIRVEYSGVLQHAFSPKLLAEREGGQFLWDVHIGGTGAAVVDWAPLGVLDPLKPALIRPEALDDSKWLNGFDWGFMDTAGEYLYATAAYLSWTFQINRDVIPASEFTRVEDLLDPRYKGKIALNDPRDFSAGALHSAVLIKALGADQYRRFLAEQDVGVYKDTRQQVEALVRGTRPISIGTSTGIIADFQRQGLGQNVRPLELPEAATLTPGQAGCACLINRAPHPNAARVYLDWWFSKEGQTHWNKANTANSRRLDVEPADPLILPKPGVDYLFIEREQNQHLRAAAMQLARETLP
jgi:iron(III) transport system substrate-binding protein